MHSNPRTDSGASQLIVKAGESDARWSILGHSKHLASPPLLISALSQLALSGGVILAIMVWPGSALPLGWHGVVAALCCYGVVTALVVMSLPRHAPHRSFGLANSVTLTRASLTALLWGILAEHLFGDALGLASHLRWLLVLVATAALLTDGLDGWIARRSGTASDFGAHFDMEVDALFLLVLSMLVCSAGDVGDWVIASGVLRYAFVVSGCFWPQLTMPLLPLWRRKVICVVQFVVLIVALAPIVPPMAAQVLCLGGLALLCYSFGVDLIWLTSEAQSRSREHSGPSQGLASRDRP
ncbi:MAG: CDP-alcohol phosphatidyltransferase family protein [Hyphomicrobiaceae bacterium]